MRKIMNCLRDLSDDADVTMDRLKTRLLPLLKGHQLLINWFLECIDSPIVESAPGDYETLTCRKATDTTVDDEADAYEHMPHSEIHADPIDSPCSLRYINGGIYYGNRTFSPAKLSFTVNNTAECNGLDGADGGDESADAKDGYGSPVKYRCVHEIKQFGDARIRDQSRFPLDVDVPADDADDSDDEGMDVTEYRSGGGGFVAAAAAAAPAEPVDVVPSVFAKNLCDDILLKAHGIRLNPSVHSSMVLNNTDMLNMLRPALDR